MGTSYSNNNTYTTERIFDSDIPVEGLLYFIESKRGKVAGDNEKALIEAEGILRKYETPEEDFQIPGHSCSAYGPAYDQFVEGLSHVVELNRELGIGDEEIEELCRAKKCIDQLVDQEWEIRSSQWSSV